MQNITSNVDQQSMNTMFAGEIFFRWFTKISIGYIISDVLTHLFLNTLRPRQNGRHFVDDTFKCIFLNENVWISLTISLKCVRKVRINNIPSLVQIMAWRRLGGKPLSEPMMVSLLTHICVTQPQWVNTWRLAQNGWHFPDDVFECIFLKATFCILIQISLMFVASMQLTSHHWFR